MESVTNRYVDLGTTQFCLKIMNYVYYAYSPLRMKRSLHLSQWSTLQRNLCLTTKLASPNGIRPVCVTRRPQNFNSQMIPAEARRFTRTQKLTLNLQVRKVRPEGLQGDLGHHDVRRPIKVDELDTSGSPSTADIQTSL
jgi:hypothetical protein